MKKIKFYIIFLSISILFLLFDWYYSRKLNLDYIKMIIFSLTIVFAYQLLRNKFPINYSLMQSFITVPLI